MSDELLDRAIDAARATRHRTARTRADVAMTVAAARTAVARARQLHGQRAVPEVLPTVHAASGAGPAMRSGPRRPRPARRA